MTTTRTNFDPLHSLTQMAALISEVTGEPVPRVIERLDAERLNPGRAVADDFARHGGPRYEWGGHLESFYNSTNAFIYELAIWNRNSLKGRMRRWTTRDMARLKRPLDLLSIGDGLGFDCLHFARKGHRVTYFELPGLCESFARKLFDRAGADIPVLTDPAAIPLASYDAITCFDVLEHVPNPPELLRNFVSFLRPGGLMYVSAPFYMIRPMYPTHLRSNRQYAGSLSLYRDAGLRLIGGHYTWYPLVFQKPGGDSLAPAHLHCATVQLTGVVQMLGRLAAWPFTPIHLARRKCNRPFDRTGA